MAADTNHVAELANAFARPENQRMPASARLALLLDGAELFHDPAGVPWATVPKQEHLETYRLDGKAFQRWVVSRFYQVEKQPPKGQAVRDALAVLEAKAIFEGPTVQVHLRCAEHGGRIYLDLGDDAWRTVEIGPDGWRVVDRPPVKFWHPAGLLPLPEPQPGGNLADLRKYLHLESDEGFVLTIAWMVGALRPHGPYPVLAVEGEQGSGKSTVCRMLRALVDPNAVPLRRPPRDERDLFISASNAWAIAYDNLSGAPDRLSDALCVLATGGGFAPRQLYADREEVLMDAQRPVMLNGIDSIVRRADLRDRTVRVLLPRLDKSKTVDEATLWERFDKACPELLGALCDAISAALRNWDSTKLDSVPRLADFARWVVAAEEVLPWEPGTFMRLYLGQLDDMATEAIEEDPIASAVIDLLGSHNNTWTGTASDLHDILIKRFTGAERVRLERARIWPTTPQALSSWLRRVIPDLWRAANVDVQFRRNGHRRTRLIVLNRVKAGSSASAAPTK